MAFSQDRGTPTKLTRRGTSTGTYLCSYRLFADLSFPDFFENIRRWNIGDLPSPRFDRDRTTVLR
jgi:hypothetical protein